MDVGLLSGSRLYPEGQAVPQALSVHDVAVARAGGRQRASDSR